MSDWTKFDITNDDLDNWVQGITPCPIAMALKRLKWIDGEEREIFTRPFRGIVQIGDQLFELCGRGKRFQRHIRESEKWHTPEKLIRFGFIYSTRLWIRWYGESEYNIEWLRGCQRYKPVRRPVSIPKVTGKPIADDMAFDLWRERML